MTSLKNESNNKDNRKRLQGTAGISCFQLNSESPLIKNAVVTKVYNYLHNFYINVVRTIHFNRCSIYQT